MERFKDVEKAMKTKAFSNEALASTSDNIDPRKKEKIDCAEFIQLNIEELQRQIESMEAKIESLSSSNKKKKIDSNKQLQINSNNELIERHKWHILMLESVLRHLENDNIDVEQINEIKDDIDYYVESNQDPNFIEDDTFYDILGLDDMEDSFAVIPTDEIGQESNSPSPSPQLTQIINNNIPLIPIIKKVIKKKDEIPINSITPISSLANQLQQTHLNLSGNINTLLSSTTTTTTSSSSLLTTPSISIDSPKLKSIVSNNLKPAQIVEAPKLKYSTVVSQSILTQSTVNNSDLGLTPKKSNTPLQSFNSLNIGLDESTTPSTPNGKCNNNNNNLLLSSSSSNIGCVTHSYFSGDLNPIFNFNDENNFNNLPIEISKYVKSLNKSKDRIFEFKEQESFHVPSKKSLPPPLKCEIKLPKLEEIIQDLETSLLTCPDSHDSDKPFKYEPVNPFVTQFSYPIEPLMDLYSPKIMELLEFDTLQYLFYYNCNQLPSQFSQFNNLQFDSKRNKNDYIKYLASNELRRRGWNYYKNSNTWVNNNNNSGSSGEIGELKCFDFYDSWLIRRQLNFNPLNDEIENGF